MGTIASEPRRRLQKHRGKPDHGATGVPLANVRGHWREVREFEREELTETPEVRATHAEGATPSGVTPSHA